MARDGTDRLSLRTEKGAIFVRTFVDARHAGHETWELTAHGTNKQIYAAYVSKERADQLESLYREDRAHYDARSNAYFESLKRLVKVGRDQLFSGNTGIVVQLAQSSGEYHLAFHQVKSDSHEPDSFDPDQFALEMAKKDRRRPINMPELSPIEGSEGKTIPQPQGQAPQPGAIPPNRKPGPQIT